MHLFFAFVIFIIFTHSFMNISALDFELCEPVEKFVDIENLCSKGYLKDVFLVPLASSNLIDPLFTRYMTFIWRDIKTARVDILLWRPNDKEGSIATRNYT